MTPLAFFGIGNSTVNRVVGLVLLVLGAIWLALVFWTVMDARRRIADDLLVGLSGAASFIFPFFGTVVYMIVRPPEYLDDVREREIEMAAAEARLHQLEGDACPHCGFEVEKAFLRCPSCLRRLKEPCATCGKPLDPRWKICPYCESEIGGAAQGRPRQRSGAASQAGGGTILPRDRASTARPAGATGGATATQRPPAGGAPSQRPTGSGATASQRSPGGGATAQRSPSTGPASGSRSTR